MTLPEDPVERHRQVAATFAERVAATRDWQAPAPVADWTARDIVSHLVEWFAGFLAAGGITLPAGPAVADDPVAAWRYRTGAVQELLERRGDESFSHPYAGTHRLADAIDRFYTADVFMHTWDLAIATGQPPTLDEEFAMTLLHGMQQMEEVLRASGQYGAPVPVADDAPAADRLMGFIGRGVARWSPG